MSAEPLALPQERAFPGLGPGEGQPWPSPSPGHPPSATRTTLSRDESDGTSLLPLEKGASHTPVFTEPPQAVLLGYSSPWTLMGPTGELLNCP